MSLLLICQDPYNIHTKLSLLPSIVGVGDVLRVCHIVFAMLRIISSIPTMKDKVRVSHLLANQKSVVRRYCLSSVVLFLIS